jgi:preprotein translocase subunit SecG
MNILYVFLSILMCLDCILLVCVVLLQLPKKEAGAGMAFGGAATEALFGAGSGNVLTKITKYLAGFFFGLALLMAVLASHQSKSAAALLLEEVTKKGTQSISQIPTAPPATTATTPANPGLLQLSNAAPVVPATPAAAPANAPAPATN